MNRLEQQYDTITFVYLDAVDGAEGQRAFTQLGLRGHPATVIFDANGTEVYRSLGVVEEAELAAVLDDL